jgi:hypothetical protein
LSIWAYVPLKTTQDFTVIFLVVPSCIFPVSSIFREEKEVREKLEMGARI